jgi:hypothetical protein
MKKTALSVAFILTLLISSTLLIGMVNSVPPYPIPTGPLTAPVIFMESPTATTYVSWFVPLTFSVNGSWNGYVRCTVEFSLDGNGPYILYNPPFFVNGISQNFSITLGPLSEGMHHVEVLATVGGAYWTDSNHTSVESNDFTSKASVYFTVNTVGQAQISILSPLNETYNIDKMIPIEFAVNRTAQIVSMGFTLDNQLNVTVAGNTTVYGPLSDGTHKLKVYSIFSDILPVSSTVYFTVDTTPPKVSILSLQNKEYNQSSIPLFFAVNESTALITYVLDGKVFTVDGNTTLTGLQNGNHTITIYATDKAGNVGTSETINFKVNEPLPPQLALTIVPPMVIVLVAGLFLLIFCRKRNQSKK